jgi:hypothetical protein
VSEFERGITKENILNSFEMAYEILTQNQGKFESMGININNAVEKRIALFSITRMIMESLYKME